MMFLCFYSGNGRRIDFIPISNHIIFFAILPLNKNLLCFFKILINFRVVSIAYQVLNIHTLKFGCWSHSFYFFLSLPPFLKILDSNRNIRYLYFSHYNISNEPCLRIEHGKRIYLILHTNIKKLRILLKNGTFP